MTKSRGRARVKKLEFISAELTKDLEGKSFLDASF